MIFIQRIRAIDLVRYHRKGINQDQDKEMFVTSVWSNKRDKVSLLLSTTNPESLQAHINLLERELHLMTLALLVEERTHSRDFQIDWLQF